jgi:hypothetical protein
VRIALKLINWISLVLFAGTICARIAPLFDRADGWEVIGYLFASLFLGIAGIVAGYIQIWLGGDHTYAFTGILLNAISIISRFIWF